MINYAKGIRAEPKALGPKGGAHWRRFPRRSSVAMSRIAPSSLLELSTTGHLVIDQVIVLQFLSVERSKKKLFHLNPLSPVA